MEKNISSNPPIVLSERLRVLFRPLLEWAGQQGARLGIDPDAVSLLGLAVVLGASILVAQGSFLAAGMVLILGALLDIIDGAIARAINRKNRFGALLDSSLDRFGDGFLFCGLGYYFAARGQFIEMGLALLALIGAYVVSYVRARAEGLGIGPIKAGLFDRLVRTILLIVMLLTGWVLPGLVILAAGNNLTAVQRILVAYRMTRPDGK
jgi:CDP-diacylglycerol--glycerol-3-phosphate 3-phosphatidyltransferase